MKKSVSLFILLCSFSFYTNVSAFWSWTDITNFFQNTFIGELFFDSENTTPEEKIPEISFPEKNEAEQLARIQKELKILQEEGIEALKEYERSHLSFETNSLETPKAQEILDRVQSEQYEDTKIPEKSQEYLDESETEEKIPGILPVSYAPKKEISEDLNVACKTVVKEFNPTRKYYFVTLPFGSQNRHREILRYKIQWFNGEWSDWFVPGVNDKTPNANTHVWSNFADHKYMVEHCETYQYSAPQSQ